MKSLLLALNILVITFLCFTSSWLHAEKHFTKQMLSQSINFTSDTAKIVAKASLCAYAAYLCIDKGYKAVHDTLYYINNMSIRNFLKHISRPVKQALIIAGLALVCYECYQSLRHDLKQAS